MASKVPNCGRNHYDISIVQCNVNGMLFNLEMEAYEKHNYIPPHLNRLNHPPQSNKSSFSPSLTKVSSFFNSGLIILCLLPPQVLFSCSPQYQMYKHNHHYIIYVVLMFQIQSNFYTAVPWQPWFCQLTMSSIHGFPYVYGFANHGTLFHVSTFFNFCTYEKCL
jgi:hypothetical protein